jgi:hypothetical protein
MGCGRGSRPEDVFASRVKSEFGLSLPCSLAWAETAPDGSSMNGVLIGTRGDSLPWAWGGAMTWPVPPDAITHDPRAMTAWSDSIAQSIRRRGYVGAAQVTDPAAKPLAIGSPAESVFIQVLWTAVMRDSVAMKTEGPRGKGLVAAGVARMLETQRAQVGPEPSPTQ